MFRLYHGQFLDDDATIIAANGPLCTPHIPRQHASTSLIDIHQYRTLPRPHLVMVVTSTFLQILMLHRDEKQRYEPPPSAASSLRIVTGATHSPPISSLLSFQSILWLDMLCFDRWRLYDTPDVVVHHRHREVPCHQQTPSCIVSIDVLTSPIPSHIDWHQW